VPVRDVNPINARYVELAARFKACWTFHRFQEGLRKFFGLHDLGPVTFDFQSLYKRLKASSRAAEGSGSRELGAELEGLAQGLALGLADLEEVDRQIAPSMVRQFFQRVDSYDERILIEMVRFYQEVQRGRSWEADRTDKVDFLVSRLAKMVAGADLSGDRRRLDRVLGSLSDNMPAEPGSGDRSRRRLELMASLRAAFEKVASFSELEERKLIGQYRTLKHSLGASFFERTTLLRIVETNVDVGRVVDRVGRWEQERIFADYERLGELGSDGMEDGELLEAVTQLHRQVGSFRRDLKSGSVRLAEVVRLRHSLGSIDASLRSRGDEPEPPPNEAPGLAPQRAGDLVRDDSMELAAPFLDELLAALALADRDLDAEAAAASHPLAALRLEPREVMAYRRLAVGGGSVARERFLLATAALRFAMEREESRPAAPGASPAVRLLELGDRMLHELSHFVEQAGREGPSEAEALLRCRMRLMRALSGLWLRGERPAAAAAMPSEPPRRAARPEGG
jgi:hypothetical protein